ncbi:hypothetical protein MMC07_005635 [Pseudocyphellaria aurata]|nr:hypothetical protein [Pseudocyphellaria aurata]
MHHLYALVFVHFITAARAAPAEYPFIDTGFLQPYIPTAPPAIPVPPAVGLETPIQPIINVASADVFANSNDWFTGPPAPLLPGIGNEGSYGTGNDGSYGTGPPTFGTGPTTVNLLSQGGSCSDAAAQPLDYDREANCENGCKICKKGSNPSGDDSSNDSSEDSSDDSCTSASLCKITMSGNAWKLCARDSGICYVLDVNRVPGARDAIKRRERGDSNRNTNPLYKNPL